MVCRLLIAVASGCRAQALGVWASVVALWAQQLRLPSSRGVAQQLRLPSSRGVAQQLRHKGLAPHSMWNHPRPGIKLMCLAL